MTKDDIINVIEKTLVTLGQKIGDSATIDGEGVFAAGDVQGYLAVDEASGLETIVMVGENDRMGAGVKITKKILFPGDEAELVEFVTAVFEAEVPRTS